MITMFPVLLAGGLGTRLWPLSREIYPKQLMNLTGGESLLQQAARRALAIAPAANVITVTTEAHFFPVSDQLSEIEPDLASRILLEPSGRNTAAAIAVAAIHARDAVEDAVLFVAPADHVIQNEESLLAAIATARQAAENGLLVTFGITATRAETGYGYIRKGDILSAVDDAHLVTSFIEKPDAATAARLIEDGCLWNSGMFVFGAASFLDELRSHASDIHDAAVAAAENAISQSGAVRFDHAAYGTIPSAPVDKAVMERSSNVAVVPVDPDWSDVGSWLKLWEIGGKTDDGNVTIGDVVVAGTTDSLIRSESRLVAAVGLDKVAIVETADAVLIAGMAHDGGIREIVNELNAAKRQEAVRHLAEDRPWGSFQVLLERPGFKIKELVVKPGGILSLQMHNHRSEHWVVVEGVARATCDDRVEDLHPNQSTYIPKQTRHRLENPGDVPVRIIEVQCGDYVGEDDIVRFDDQYGRTPQT